MALGLFSKIFGTRNDRELRRYRQMVDRVNALEEGIVKLDDDALKAKTVEFKGRLSQGETLDDILPEAFAVVREAGVRALGMRHFDVQLIGGLVLHEGKISEMKTGEGKTLVATLPVYLNALTGKGVHVVTVNEYLAQRDAEWMGKLYTYMGLSVGVVRHSLNDEERRAAYLCDVTYATNNELGFDYLRDNMKYDARQFAQRELNFAIVDEVDSILIDESRTPLIISGLAEESTTKYGEANKVIPYLKKDKHYTVEEKSKTAALSEAGIAEVEKILGVENLYDPKNIEILHCVSQALRAHTMYKNEVDYVVSDEGQVVIIDEFTGRMMTGRRYGDGLHQALEAKEGVTIENENQTLATITFQNYFRMYEKLAGMTGTADTEASEFHSIYGLEVVVIPTNKPMVREDHPDVIYGTEKEKFDAVVEEVRELNKIGRPVLVGTISIEKSEALGKLLTRFGIKHSVLNAKRHAQEAEIIAQAGQEGAVTIATNMAGRGTDIVLGKTVPALGGLHILGTERHESRRIDNQLRGRSGRQGDKGSSRFYLSLDDDLMRIFGSEKISGLMQKLGLENGQPIEHTMISRAVANAQKKVEAHHFDSRKHLLEYDDVMNKQREVLYSLRKDILLGENQNELLMEMAEEVLINRIEEIAPDSVYPEEWNIEELNEFLFRMFGIGAEKPNDEEIIINGKITLPLEHCDKTKLTTAILDELISIYNHKVEDIRPEAIRNLEKMVMLQVLDKLWKDHLLGMDHMKEGIGLRGYAQKNPLTEYKKEGFAMFAEMMNLIQEECVEFLFKAQYSFEESHPEESHSIKELEHKEPKVVEHRGDEVIEETPEPVKRDETKVGRNDPCSCGSGKKYKKCCGQ
jgi:preprotein translocase subunit SecA